MSRVFLIISLIINAVLGFLFLRPRPITPNLYQVDRVIDGDTFVVKNNTGLPAGRQEVRLMSVNAPEVGLCGSTEATAKLKSLILGKKVRLEGDLNDHFGRFLALVYVDDILINKEMILSGWARFTSTASTESENLKSAFQKIKTEKLGVFSPQCYQNTNPQNPKCNIKGNVKEGKKTYFFLGCGNYSNVALELDQGDQWFCSESAAVSAGFTKSANCYAKVY